MMTLVIKLILLLFGLFLPYEEASPILSVTALLVSVILTSLNQYLASRRFTVISSSAYFVISVFQPVFCPFLPLFCFDLFSLNLRFAVIFVLIPLITNFLSGKAIYSVFILLLILLALLMRYMCDKISRLTEENKHIRDSGAEQSRLLAQKNKYLMDKQDYEIHLATLKERNRIAREIHDNVGHILSRSILQAGALQAINKDEQLTAPLNSFRETLTLAMDSIRGSVHDLKDESVDLYDSLSKMLEPEPYKINLDYDITRSVPNNIKYCFLAVIKEALTNIAKHSDATSIRIAVHEHPALYQLLIHDNGTKKPSGQNDGMGISNMEDRVKALDGQLSVSYKNGFRIFISIPKQEGNNK